MKFWMRRKKRRPAKRRPWLSVLELLETRTLLAAPVVNTIADQFVAVGAGFTLSVASTDADGDDINLSVSLANGGVLPPWLVFTPGPPSSGTGTFNVAPAAGPFGSIDVKVTVTDENGETGSDTFTIVATDASLTPNVQIANQTVGVHTPVVFSVPATAFTNVDGDLLTLSATTTDGLTLPAWLKFTPGPAAAVPTGTFSGTPLDTDVGVTNVKLTAVSPTGEAAIQLFTIEVLLNHTPEFTKGADQTPGFNPFPQSYTVADWATGIVEGPPEEYAQTLQFLISTDNDALFSVLPQITIDESMRQPDGTLRGTLTYTIAGGAIGTAKVTVRLKDNGGNASGGVDTSDPQVFVIAVTTSTDAGVTVTPLPNQTIGVHTPFTLSANGVFNGGGEDLTLSATLADGRQLPTWLTFTPGPAGLPPTGTFSGTPLDADIGTINVMLTATDPNGFITTDTFSITVTVNQTPQFTKGADQTVDEDSGAVSVVGWATGILAGPPTETGQVVDFLVTTNNDALFSVLPAVSPTGTLTFTPAANAFGTATVTVRIHDNGGTASGGVDTSDPQTFLITVNGVNDAPTFTLPLNPPASNEDAGPQTVPNFTTNMLAGPANESGQTLTFNLTQIATTGGLTFLTAPSIDPITGTLTYEADADSFGTATYEVTLSDDGGTLNGGVDTSITRTFTITIRPVNDAPDFTLSSGVLNVSEDAPLQTVANFVDFAMNVSTGPANEASQTITKFTVTQIASTGDLSFITAPSIDPTNGTLTYQPTPQTFGTATFSVTMMDDGGTDNGGVDTSVSRTFIIAVASVNDAPSFTLAGNPPASAEDAGPQTVSGFATNISSGPSNESGQTLTFNLTLTSSTGGLTFSTAPSIDPVTGDLTYEATPDANGTATFEVTLMDNGGGADTSVVRTFTITVTPVVDIVADSLTTTEDTAVSANVITGTNGASADNFEGAAVLTSVTQGANGSVTFAADGTVTYTPNPDFNGVDTFTYTVTSGGTTETATVTVTVNAVTEIVADALTTTEDTAVTANLITGTNGASADNFEGAAVLTSVTQGANGSVTFAANGTVTYTPNPDFNGVDTFTYTVTSGGTTETATVTVTVTAVTDIVADALTTTEDTAVTANLITGTNGASADNFEGSPAITSVTQGTNGSVTFTAAGTVTYTPNPDFNGVDTFTYTVTSGGTTETATVTVTVTAVTDIVADALTTTEDTAVTANLITGTNGASADNFEGTPVLTSVTQGANGSVTFSADGTVTYTPNLNFNGVDTFTYTVTSGGVTETATVTVTVTDVNDPPTFNLIANPDLRVSLDAGPQTVVIATDIDAGAPDEAGQALHFLVTTDNPGLFAVLPKIAPDGTLTFTPLRGFGGTATITVKLIDDGGTANGGSDTSQARTFTITTFKADVSYVATGKAQLRANVVNGRLIVRINGVPQSTFQTELIETLTLTGGSKGNVVDLSGLNPELYPNLKSIVINGGSGKDAITMAALHTGSFDRLETIEINGNAGNDAIKLTELPTSLFPVLTSFMIRGGDGNDTIFGSFSDETIDGGKGNDLLLGGGGNDVIDGGAGNDQISGEAGDDELSGGAGKDTILGGLGDDILRGGDGNDLLIGGFGDDDIDGEAGNDKAVGGQGGPARGGLSVADAGDVIAAESIDEAFKKLFAFE